VVFNMVNECTEQVIESGGVEDSYYVLVCCGGCSIGCTNQKLLLFDVHGN